MTPTLQDRLHERVRRLCRGHRAKLVRHAMRFVGQPRDEEAEDVVQTCFVRLLDEDDGGVRLREIADGEDERTEDLKTAYKSVEYLAHNARRKEEVRDAEPLTREDALQLSDKTDLCEVLQMRQDMRDVNAALGTLSPGEREVVEMKYLEGRNRSEIAAIRGCSVETVKTLLKRAMRKLRKFLQEGVPP